MKTILTSILIILLVSNVVANNDRKILAETSLAWPAYMSAEKYMAEKNYEEAYVWYYVAREHFQKILDLNDRDELDYTYIRDIIIKIDRKMEEIKEKTK